MKLFLLCFFISYQSFSMSILDTLRSQFPNIESKEQANFFIEQLKNEKNAITQAYVAAMYFMNSRYAKFPLTKYKYFKKGKLILDKLIVENPANIEIHYIRFLLQHQIPKFLGYNSNIESDFEIVKKYINRADLEVNFKRKIIREMLLVDDLTGHDRKELTQVFKTLK